MKLSPTIKARKDLDDAQIALRAAEARYWRSIDIGGAEKFLAAHALKVARLKVQEAEAAAAKLKEATNGKGS